MNNIFIQYFNHGAGAYREKVYYYDEHMREIQNLHFEDRIEIDLDYVLCLFEIGKYEKFLTKVDTMIELVISENIYSYDNTNIYNELLFRKSASLYQLGKYKEGMNILRQLMKIDKGNSVYAGFYLIISRKHNNDFYLTWKATAMAAFLLVVGITLAEIFFVNLLAVYFNEILVLRTILIVYGVCTILGIELLYQLKMYRETGMLSFRLITRIFGR